ncbi:MAG: peptidase M64 N-terminal domain-containing protein, partial [Ignavibacteria bacterium]|nr:peptidase M64 N-terminal domain-containing protein [Ignavibacteria bacterium]
MKAIFFFFILSISILSQNNPRFDEYFLDETLRIDYFHIGDAKTEMITIDKLFRYGIWAGSLTHLLDNLNNGKYYCKIYDAASNNLIYSKGFDTFFGEYATGDDGIKGVMKSFHESVILPFPKNKIIFAIEKRDDANELVEFFRTEVDPKSIYIIKDKIVDETVEIVKPVYNGDPHNKADIVILAEGYTKSEK